MTAQQTGNDPLSDVPEHTGEPVDAEETRVFVKPDIRIVMSRLLGCSPLVAIAAVRVGEKMDEGPGRMIGILGVVLPYVWAVMLCTLRWANAGILLADGVLTVRNRWSFKVLEVPVPALTGLYHVGSPLQRATPFNDRVVITRRAGRPFLVNLRAWDEQGLEELWHRLPLRPGYGGSLEGPALRERFPGVDWPWYHNHHRLASALVTVVGVCVWLALLL